MGRIVINETENKQTVILNDTPEGVSGGYFDEEMNWSEFGGGIDPLMTENLENSGLALTSATDKAVHIETNAKRAHVPLPVVNNFNKVKIVDENYDLIVWPITSPNIKVSAISANYYACFLTSVSAAPAWAKEASVDSPYAWIMFRKVDNSNFTEDELVNAYGRIYEVV